MKCNYCGSENPNDSFFCFQCGSSLKQEPKQNIAEKNKTLICSKCGVVNPKDAQFCYECGSSIQKIYESLTYTCPTCGMHSDQKLMFCPNCGFDFKKEERKNSLKFSSEKPVSPFIPSRVNCPSCGQLTSGEYCYNCGYHITEIKKKNAIDYWYCSRESCLMTEIDPNAQILISRKNMNESIVEAINNGSILPHERIIARELSQELVKEGISNFVALTKVKCPICGQQSIASATNRPKIAPRDLIPYYSLNAGLIIKNGFHYLRYYPKLLLIIIAAILVELAISIFTYTYNTAFLFSTQSGLLELFNISSASYLDPDLDIVDLLFYSILTSLIAFFVNNLFICWYTVSLRNIRRNQTQSIDILTSFKDCVTYYPQILISQFFVLVITFSLTFGIPILSFIIIYILTINNSYGNYSSFLIVFILFMIIIIGVIVVSFVLMILFSYVTPSIIFDETGVILSLKRSWRFGRKHFQTTLGVSIIYGLATTVLIFFISPMYIYMGILAVPLSLVLSNIVSRIIECYRSLSFGWAFDEFKHTIE